MTATTQRGRDAIANLTLHGHKVKCPNYNIPTGDIINTHLRKYIGPFNVRMLQATHVAASIAWHMRAQGFEETLAFEDVIEERLATTACGEALETAIWANPWGCNAGLVLANLAARVWAPHRQRRTGKHVTG